MSDEQNGPGGLNLDIGSLMQKAQEVQRNMQDAKDAAAKIKVEGNAGGGMVVAEANGNGTILRITIEAGLLKSGDKAMIEDLTAAAVNQALQKSKAAAQEELSKATGGLPMPGALGDLSKLF